jgi:hypothetical protein
MAKVTQDLNNRLIAKNPCKLQWLLQLCIVALISYTPEILNTNIEQEYPIMPRLRTPQEVEFLDYFRRINKSAINGILSQYLSTGPLGYDTSLVLARILKVKDQLYQAQDSTTGLRNSVPVLSATTV